MRPPVDCADARRRTKERKAQGLKRPGPEEGPGALPGLGQLGCPVPRVRIDGCGDV